MSVREELAGCVGLQHLLEQRASLRREMDTPPEELVALRQALAIRRESLGAKQKRREELLAEQEHAQTDADALREEREHFRKQKSMVTNMKQLQAVVSELDHVDVQLKGREDRLIEIMAELEALDRDIATLQEETPDERARRETAEAAWQERNRDAAGELQAVERRLREIQRALGEPAVARFKKLWTSRKPLAVVPLDGTSCSACHAELRPSLVQQVRTLESLQTCDTCRRLLYDPEQFTNVV